MNKIYSINNLQCKYRGAKYPTLIIDSLQIKQGNLVFFIGPSGVGKSTILETLGLMNNTLNPQADSRFLFTYEGEEVNLLTIWKSSESNISKFRRKHLSFIFQNTNLFQNLSLNQNACITQVIQGKHLREAARKIKTVFSSVLKELISPAGIIEDKEITKISGGQRQRVAFSRAISTDFHVLFADEPTGNLDWWNANNLMKHLKECVNEKGQTAIIVTHDIEIALAYADMVVAIEKKNSADYIPEVSGYQYGYIGEACMLKRNGQSGNWIKASGEIIAPEIIRENLKSVFGPGTSLPIK